MESLMFILMNTFPDVNPFIGTSGQGHTFPGAVRPFGKVQLSPDSVDSGWDYCSGYRHNTLIGRVSHLHLSGTGCGDGYDIGWKFQSFVPTEEFAKPGYYMAKGSSGQQIELTVSENCGITRYLYVTLTLDLTSSKNWDTHISSKHEVYNNGGYGYRTSHGWTKNTVYFNYTHINNTITTCIDHKHVPEVDAVSFDEEVIKNVELWTQALSPLKSDNTILQTALYHSLIHPSKYTENDYTVFSTWDIYRSWNALMTWIHPEQTIEWTKSMVQMEYLPVWELWGYDTLMMGTSSSISMIGEYVNKGVIQKSEDICKAINRTLYRPGRLFDDYYNFGYVPKEASTHSASITLEYSYLDYVIETLGCEPSRNINSSSWKVLFNEDMFYTRTILGVFDKSGFDKVHVNHVAQGFDEGSAITYKWSVLHDFKSLIALHDPNNQNVTSCSTIYPCEKQIDGEMLKQLIEWYNMSECGSSRENTHCLGYHAQSNEPSHHVPYLFSVLGHPELTCKYVSSISEMYTNNTDGIPGNDDAGQLSSWILFAALGFYPINPLSGVFILGCPVYSNPISMGNLTVTKIGVGLNPTYYLNGVLLKRNYLMFDELHGELTVHMA